MKFIEDEFFLMKDKGCTWCTFCNRGPKALGAKVIRLMMLDDEPVNICLFCAERAVKGLQDNGSEQR